MKTVHSTSDHLILRGLPGGASAIVVPLGLAVVGGLALAFGFATGAVVPLVAGGIMLLAAAGAAVVAWTARESLRLNLASRTGRFTRTSLIPSERANFEFAFDAAHSVCVEREEVRGPSRGHRTSTHWRARLRLTRPRRAIVLAESQGGKEQAVRPIAEQVARALNIPLVDQTGDEAETRRGQAIGAPAGVADLNFGPPPPGSRTSIHIDLACETVTLEWKTIGGPALPALGLLAIGFFALIATAMMLQALSIPVLAWLMGQTSATARPAPPLMIGALVAMAATLWLVWLLILELWLVSRRRLVITPDRTMLVRVSPSADALRAAGMGSLGRRFSVPTDDIRSIRTHDDTIEIRTTSRTCAAMIHLPAEKEVAWAAKAARAALGAIGPQAESD